MKRLHELFIHRGVLFVLLAGLSAGSSILAARSAAPVSDARDLLARMRHTYTEHPSVTTSFVQTYAPAGFAETSPEVGRMTLQAPAQIRFDYDGEDGKLFTFDGQNARQYVAADKQVIVKSLTEGDRARLPLVFFDSPENVLKKFDATFKAAQNGLFEVVLSPKVEGGPKNLTLLATGSGEVKRLTIVDDGGNRTTFSFTQFKGGARRPASDFAFVPPAGTKVITE